MPTTLPNMNLTLPVRGAPGSGQWGDTIDANLALLDAHNHQTGHGPPITTAAISIDADLPFSALWAPTQLHRVQFSNIAAGGLTAGQRKSLFVSDGTGGGVSNELYWHNNAGNKVQLTAGNTLNFAAFVGGIGGDYTSVGAQLNYNDGQKAYEFKEGTIDSNAWARLRTGDVRLLPFNTTSGVFVGMAAPVGIAGSYTVTWPLALPGSTLLQQIDNTGQAIFSNTVPNAVTFSALVTASAGVTLSSNQNVTLSGTGVVKHGTYTLQLAGSAFVASATDAAAAYNFTNGAAVSSAAFNYLAPINLPQGDRILAIRVFMQDSAGGPTKIQATFVSSTSTGTATNIASSAVSAGSGANQTLTIGSLTTTIAASTSYFVKVLNTTGTNTCTVYMAEVDYDNP